MQRVKISDSLDTYVHNLTPKKMKTNKRAKIAAISLLTLAALLNSLNAAINVTVQEIGSDVVFSASGSIDLTGVSIFGTNPSGWTEAVRASDAVFSVGLSNTAITAYDLSGGSASIGSGGYFSDTSSTAGASIFVAGDDQYFAVPDSYVSGSSIASGTTTYASHTLDTLGITPGTYVWTVSNGDTITLNAIPEPSAYTLIMGLLVAGWIARRQSR